jgi:raffinose/stachyose/melibiose transport system permease protein
MSSQTLTKDPKPGSSRTSGDMAPRSSRIPRAFYLMVVPAFVLFFVLHTVPLLQGVFYSFTDYAGYGTWEFVGLSNYLNLFKDDRILDSYLFTFQFAIVATVLVNILSLAVALGLNAKIKARTFFRGVFFVPSLLSILIIGYVFNYLFANSVPAVAESLGITALASNILADPGKAWIGVVLVAVWQAAAFNIIIYLAGLQTIPNDVYEAASIDGAGPWRTFTSITFPLIGAFFTINMVLSLKNFLMVFDQIVSLTGGGPGTSTESISLVIYRSGFQGGEYAFQTANSVVYLIVIVAISLFQLRVLQRREVSV